HAIIDASGNWLKISALERTTPGIVDRLFVQRLASHPRIQFPSIVVKRSVFERIGGFNAELCYALDWEMWTRIALQFPVWFEPRILACYRDHAENETSRLRKRGETASDVINCINIMKTYAPVDLRSTIGTGAYAILRDDALASATELLRAGDRRQ